jgi:hypothetical protein
MADDAISYPAGARIAIAARARRSLRPVSHAAMLPPRDSDTTEMHRP